MHGAIYGFYFENCLCKCAIREMFVPSFNQSQTKINANNRIARGLQAFKSAVTPSLAFAA